MSDTLAPIEFDDVDIQVARKKPAVYIRVSSKDQSKASQMHELVKWLLEYKNASDETVAALQDDPKELKRWMTDAATWYVDEGTSGDRIHDRPAFNAMQKAIFDGQHDTVIVWKLDRLSRKMSHGIQCLSDWLERGIHFISTTQRIDLTGPVGKIIAAVLLGVAEMEQETRRERQRAGIEAKKKSHPGCYKRAARKGAEKRTGKRKENPKRALELKQQGHSLAEIANILNVGRTTAHRYLKEAEASSQSGDAAA